jgi:hypothetical protein
MTRWCVAAALLAAGCAFNPAGFETDGGDRTDATHVDAGPPADAGPDASADAAVADAGADARQADAAVDAGGPDARQGCTGPAYDLPLSRQPRNETTVSTGESYEPTCGGGDTSDDQAYRVVVPLAFAGQDLVVDLNDSTSGNTLDGILEVSDTCQPTSSLGCSDVSPTGHGEAVVVKDITAGTYFVVVDGFGSDTGTYSVRAFPRPLRAEGQTCDFTMDADRCATGACADTNDDGVATCGTLPVVSDVGNTTLNCVAATPHANDFVYTGTLSDGGDVDVLLLTPTADATLRVTVTDADGGCSQDVDLRVFTLSPGCSEITELSDAQSGLGSCARISAASPKLLAGRAYWLELRPGTNATTGGAYVAVIDLVYP